MNISDKLQRDGFVVLDSYEPEQPTEKLLDAIGEALVLGKGGAVHQLRPHKLSDAPINTYSGNYGLGEFPLHTDLAHWYLPPRYFLLRCIYGFGDVPTLVVDGDPLVAEIGITALARALVQPRRPVDGRKSLLRLYQDVGAEVPLLRWDEKFIQPATDAGAEGVLSFKRVLAETERLQVKLSKPGDTLIIDNWRMLHGRGAVPEQCQERVLDRVYLRSLK
jgi:L-asparagine oxygenase